MITIQGFHRKMRNERGFANDFNCIDCGEQALDWSWTHDTDPYNMDNYNPRCRSCHMKYDGQRNALGKTWSLSDETKEKMSKPKSDETRVRMAAAQRKRWEDHRNSVKSFYRSP